LACGGGCTSGGQGRRLQGVFGERRDTERVSLRLFVSDSLPFVASSISLLLVPHGGPYD